MDLIAHFSIAAAAAAAAAAIPMPDAGTLGRERAFTKVFHMSRILGTRCINSMAGSVLLMMCLTTLGPSVGGSPAARMAWNASPCNLTVTYTMTQACGTVGAENPLCSGTCTFSAATTGTGLVMTVTESLPAYGCRWGSVFSASGCGCKLVGGTQDITVQVCAYEVADGGEIGNELPMEL